MSRIAEQNSLLGPTVASGSPGRFYRPELDVLRLFAFLSVFLHHGPRSHDVTSPGHRILLLFQESGGFGLPIFFFLSAYLITELLLLERSHTGTIHLKAFYTRRILRIRPLYIGFTLFAWCLGEIVGHSYRIPIYTVLAYLLFAGNFVKYPWPSPIGPLWSISVEEQFYVVWPWLAKFGGTRTLTVASLLIIPVSFLATFYLAWTGHEPNSSIWENSIVQFLFFATGTLMAVSIGARTPSIHRMLRIGLFMTGVLLALGAEHFAKLKAAGVYRPAWKICVGYGLVDIACIAIFLSLLGCSARVLPKPAIYLGKISYGLYVFHDLCFEISKRIAPPHLLWIYLLAIVLTVAMAIPSYDFFERPFLRLKNRFEYVRTRTA